MSDRIITTNHLTLRPLAKSDASAIFALFSDEETLRYWNAYLHQNVDETAAMIGRITGRESSCYWAICKSGSEEAIGYVGYVGNTSPAALVYILHRDHWGNGYGTETLRAAVIYGFDKLKLDRIEMWIHPDNLASIKVAEKVGFTYRGRKRTRFVNAAVSHDLSVYGLRASEWFHLAGALSAPAEQQFYGLRPVLPVRDIQEALAYYCEKLDFVIDFVTGDPPVLAGVSRGEWSSEAVRIHFVKAESRAKGLITQAEGQVADPVPSGWLTIIAGPDLDGLCEEYRERGVKIVSEPAMSPWGGREFEIADCNGYGLRFWTM